MTIYIINIHNILYHKLAVNAILKQNKTPKMNKILNSIKLAYIFIVLSQTGDIIKITLEK